MSHDIIRDAKENAEAARKWWTRGVHLEKVCELAQHKIGLARMALDRAMPEQAQAYLNQYCEEMDRLEVRHLGLETAERLLASGIINPTRAFADEIAKMRQSIQ